jgi:hypothetical protein
VSCVEARLVATPAEIFVGAKCPTSLAGATSEQRLKMERKWPTCKDSTDSSGTAMGRMY